MELVWWLEERREQLEPVSLLFLDCTQRELLEQVILHPNVKLAELSCWNRPFHTCALTLTMTLIKGELLARPPACKPQP